MIYSGGLVSGRGIEFLCGVFVDLPKEIHIVFLGFGGLTEIVAEYEGQAENIHLLPVVQPSEVIQTKCGADIGICLLDSDALSYCYALPNKLFEYSSAELPAIVNNDYPEMADFVEKYDCGWLAPYSKASVADLLQNISGDEIEAKKAGACKAAEDNRWSTEAAHLMDIYDNFLVGRPENNGT